METQVPSCKSGTWCIQGGKSYPSILGGTYEPEGVKVKVRGDPYVFKVGGGPPNGPNNFTYLFCLFKRRLTGNPALT